MGLTSSEDEKSYESIVNLCRPLGVLSCFWPCNSVPTGTFRVIVEMFLFVKSFVLSEIDR